MGIDFGQRSKKRRVNICRYRRELVLERDQRRCALGPQLRNALTGGLGGIKSQALQEHRALGIDQLEIKLAVFLAVLFEASQRLPGCFARRKCSGRAQRAQADGVA